MHELSIAMSIVEIAEKYAAKEGAARVVEMELEVGELSGVVVDALEFAMEEAVVGTVCEGATWKIVAVPGLVKCRACGHRFPAGNLFVPCPQCGQFGMDLVQGDEMRLRTLMVE